MRGPVTQGQTLKNTRMIRQVLEKINGEIVGKIERSMGSIARSWVRSGDHGKAKQHFSPRDFSSCGNVSLQRLKTIRLCQRILQL
jgi:hypothetical protein